MTTAKGKQISTNERLC